MACIPLQQEGSHMIEPCQLQEVPVQDYVWTYVTYPIHGFVKWMVAHADNLNFSDTLNSKNLNKKSQLQPGSYQML